MRIQSTTEVSTRQQHNPFLSLSAGSVMVGKSASIVSFEECLKAQMQNAATPAMTRKAELMATSSIWGYFIQGASAKQELKIKERA